LCTKRP